jgi:hypothetical protein
MKIQRLTDAIRNFTRVEERDNPSGGGNQQHPHRDPDKDQAPSEPIVVEDATVSAAVEAFQKDAQTQAAHLTAVVNGRGPGLRVVLKDPNGTVVRQFTAREFLEMRQATRTDGRIRGKILDQKL